MIGIARTLAVAAAGAIAWIALRALLPRTPAPVPHALETWEGEGGSPAPVPHAALGAAPPAPTPGS